MSTLSLIPTYQYSTGEVLTAAVLNNPLSAIQAWSSTIDNTNIGTAGVFASQLKPTNTTQSTFGGSVGYTFLAPASSYVPLTVSGVSGQTADIFDVTLTSGGTKAFSLDSLGQGKFLAGATTSVPLTVSGVSGQTADLFDVTLTSGGTKALSIGSTGAATFLAPAVGVTPLTVSGVSGQTANLQTWTATSGGTVVLSITATGTLTASSTVLAGSNVQAGTLGSISSGVLSLGTAAGNGLSQIGTSTSSVQTIVGSSFYLFNNNATAFATIDGSGNLGIAGTLHQASARSMKKNIEPFVGDALRDVLAVKAYRYHFNAEENDVEKHVGLIADEAPKSLYRSGPSGKPEDVAVDPYWLSVVTMVAIQQLHAKLDVILEGKLSAS